MIRNIMIPLTITTTDYDTPPETGYMIAIISITILILFMVFIYILLRKRIKSGNEMINFK